MLSGLVGKLAKTQVGMPIALARHYKELDRAQSGLSVKIMSYILEAKAVRSCRRWRRLPW